MTMPRVNSNQAIALRLELLFHLLPRFVARLRLIIRGIETRQRHAAIDLRHDPAFETFLFDGDRRHFVDHRGRNDDGAILIGDDDIVREDRNAAATNWLLPVDERKTRDRWRRGNAGG